MVLGIEDNAPIVDFQGIISIIHYNDSLRPTTLNFKRPGWYGIMNDTGKEKTNFPCPPPRDRSVVVVAIGPAKSINPGEVIFELEFRGLSDRAPSDDFKLPLLEGYSKTFGKIIEKNDSECFFLDVIATERTTPRLPLELEDFSVDHQGKLTTTWGGIKSSP